MSPGLDVSKYQNKSRMSLRRVQRPINGVMHYVQNSLAK